MAAPRRPERSNGYWEGAVVQYSMLSCPKMLLVRCNITEKVNVRKLQQLHVVARPRPSLARFDLFSTCSRLVETPESPVRHYSHEVPLPPYKHIELSTRNHEAFQSTSTIHFKMKKEQT